MALDQAFDADTLIDLRKAIQAEAASAGLPDARVLDVVLAVHELAANAVRYGGGAGRVRVWLAAGWLRCQVSDAGPGSGDNGRADRRWPLQPGHGLWLVAAVADDVSIAAGVAGSVVTAVFTVPGLQIGSAGL